jgi:ABC-type cobalamin/Fe3+-siderophores transport system ATPase subunit
MTTKRTPAIFYRPPLMRGFRTPAIKGNLSLLNRYLVNVHPADRILLICYICYTLSHPKTATTKFLVLIVSGSEGSGKSTLCRLILDLIDPSIDKIHALPESKRELGIVAINNHLAVFDNNRVITPKLSDLICQCATGGVMVFRMLYEDAEQVVINLHLAPVFNGIGNLVLQPDLAQRSLVIPLDEMAAANRQSDQELTKNLEADLPQIQMGIFELIAQIFVHLPNIKLENPQRMVGYQEYLAAMEIVNEVPFGVYQGAYVANLQQGQLDTLMENLLAATIVEFADALHQTWEGTPTELLRELERIVPVSDRRSTDWPQNAIALGKRIGPLQTSLKAQGIIIRQTRGKHRKITVTTIKIMEC